MGIAFQPGDPTFNRANALYLAHASDIAYVRAPVTAARERLQLKAISFRNPITRTRGFLGVCETHAVLAFRGTQPTTLPNWVTDAVVRLVAHGELEGRVHQGFNSALKRTWDLIEPILDAAGDVPLFVTGHSMGGALAALAACKLARIGRPPVATYTFGAPRFGDPAFCAGYALPLYRVVNRLDLVPEMPLASMRKLLPAKPRLTNEKFLGQLHRWVDRASCYGHVNTFVYIDRDGSVTCNADVEPWHAHAVARAIATRGSSFHEGISDHLIGSYIHALEGRPCRKQTGMRRQIRVD